MRKEMADWLASQAIEEFRSQGEDSGVIFMTQLSDCPIEEDGKKGYECLSLVGGDNQFIVTAISSILQYLCKSDLLKLATRILELSGRSDKEIEEAREGVVFNPNNPNKEE